MSVVQILLVSCQQRPRVGARRGEGPYKRKGTRLYTTSQPHHGEQRAPSAEDLAEDLNLVGLVSLSPPSAALREDRLIMKVFTLALCVAAVVALAPECSGRVRRAALPQRTMMFYYNRPHPGYGRPFVSRNYEPHTAMSAFAAGNTVSAGSFYGAQQQPQAAPAPDCSQCNGVLPPAAPEVPSEEPTPAPAPAAAPAPEDRPEEAVPEESPVVDEQPEEQLPNDEPVAVSTETPAVVKDEPKNKDTPRGKVPSSKPGKRRPTPPVQEDEEDDDDDSDEEQSPLPGLLPGGKKKKGQGNFYNSYFPIFFGGYPSGRSGADGGNPGAATAIANSFSTGKGAVATSHATAYGGPAPNGNGYKKNGAKARYSSTARS